MIYQCGLCFRLLPYKDKPCKYCQSTQINLYPQTENNEYINYEIFIPSIKLDHKEYKIIKKIGQGGVGTILLVEDVYKNKYALKVPFLFDANFSNNTAFPQKILKESFDQIIKEIKSIKTQSTRFQLNIHSFGKTISKNPAGNDITIYYILMEYALGTLHDLIIDESSGYLHIPTEEKFVMMSDIMASLEELHLLRSAHGDMHPANIFLVERNDEIHYIVADKDSSKSLSTSVTHSVSDVRGHKNYIDPVKLFNSQMKEYIKNDIWSLGVIISEIANGNFWPNLCPKSSKDATSVDFYSNFLILKKSSFESSFFKILKKATTPKLKDRYHQVKSFSKDLSKIKKRFQKKGYYNFTNSIRLFFQLKLSLPYSEYHNGPFNIPFNGDSKIDLLQYSDYLIDMNRIQIERCRINGTKLYSASVDENRYISLKANRDYWREKSAPFEKILRECKGLISFHFSIDLNYLK